MHPIRALFGHEAWATRELLRRCGELDPQLLGRETPGTLGTIPRTMTHLVGTGQFLLALLTGEQSEQPIAAGQELGLAALGPVADENEARWRAVLEGSPDPDGVLFSEQDDGPARWVAMAQYPHHGDTHRAHVASTLGAAGVQPPSLSGWAFGKLDPAAGGPAGEWADRLLVRCFDHAAWAAHEVLEHCLGLGEDALRATAAGTYGTVHETLTHLLDAHAGYLDWLVGGEDVELQGAADPDVLRACEERARGGWRAYLESAPDHEREVRTGGRPAPAWVVTLQATHHVNDHLAHVGTILGANGLPVPDVDVWVYGSTPGAAAAG
jgi:uncharacterized damage-inducible protein DinB